MSNYSNDNEISEQKKLLSERMAFISELAEQYGLRAAIENVGFSYNSSLVADMPDFLALADNTKLDFLVDIGHAHANGWDIPLLIDTLGSRICGFHFHDNDGESDTHMPIGSGTSDWDKIFAAIERSAACADRTIEYAAPYVNDISAGIDLIRNRLDK